MKKLVLNTYLRWPLLWDGAISLALYLGINTYFGSEPCETSRPSFFEIISSVISTCVSLAGFILAALTIIVTFKSNLKAKGVTEADDAMELILSTKHYDSIVSVFKYAIVELIVVAMLLYLVSALNENFTTSVLLFITLISIFITALTVWRSLFVLFKILAMEKKNLSEKRS